jgi:alanyl-tRNA synthetase
LKRELSRYAAQAAAGLVDQLAANAVEVNGVKVIAHRCDDWDADAMRGQIELLRKKLGPVAVLLASGAGGKVLLIAGLATEVVARGQSAVEWVKAAAKPVGGGGGGRPDMAQAGGKQPEQLDEALRAGLEYIKAKLS